ncbi:hypothetical protein [Streptomyces omiyaensis]|uniref:Nudix hydrolase domain-containing protein n=1 Tax=Streptomyces omiyaensis TaxID=68247 RepID=A0ABW7BMK8_9ACTN|nr:hypothetical protein [Streptomyces omiyaensis]GGY25672.1 hypothetical protein GCM10010363_02470 [Streptomyces omiyaensis]
MDIDLGNGILGAILGVVFATLFQQWTQDVWFKVRRRAAGKVRSLTYRAADGGAWGTFSLGPLRTSALIVEGDGERPIAPEAVHVRVMDGEVELPAELAPWRAEIEAEEARASAAGERRPVWNGERYAVEAVEVTRTPPDEASEVHLRLRPTDYYTFLAAQQLDRRLPDGSTPRGRWLDPDAPLTAPAFLQCSFGVNVAVVTSDDLLVINRRGDGVRTAPGLWNSSVNEGLARPTDSAGRHAPDLHAVARRGMREELSLEPHEFTLSLLAFVLDVDARMWSAHFYARLTGMTGEELRARTGRGVADRWEHSATEYVPFRTADVARHLLAPERRHRWAPLAPALFHLALVHVHGRASVERAEAAAVRRLSR